MLSYNTQVLIFDLLHSIVTKTESKNSELSILEVELLKVADEIGNIHPSHIPVSYHSLRTHTCTPGGTLHYMECTCGRRRWLLCRCRIICS